MKPVTVTIDENVRTVQAIPVSGSAHKHSALATPYGTRNKGGKGKGKRGSSSNSSASTAKAMRMTTTTGGSRRVVPVPVSAESHAHGHPMLVDTPSSSSSSHSNFGTPAAAANSSTAFHPTNGGFPFLPPFLEDDQILNIATPQQHQHSSSAASPLPSSSREPLSPMGAHYSWMFTKDKTAAGPGGDLLSPLAPACNYGQVFDEESEEKLQRLAKKQNAQLRSPVELADLDQSLLLGDEEATSPFAFLEKTTSAGTDPILPKGTSLDFLASPGFSSSSHHPARRSAAVSLEDDFFLFAF